MPPALEETAIPIEETAADDIPQRTETVLAAIPHTASPRVADEADAYRRHAATVTDLVQRFRGADGNPSRNTAAANIFFGDIADSQKGKPSITVRIVHPDAPLEPHHPVARLAALMRRCSTILDGMRTCIALVHRADNRERNTVGDVQSAISTYEYQRKEERNLHGRFRYLELQENIQNDLLAHANLADDVLREVKRDCPLSLFGRKPSELSADRGAHPRRITIVLPTMTSWTASRGEHTIPRSDSLFRCSCVFFSGHCDRMPLWQAN